MILAQNLFIHPGVYQLREKTEGLRDQITQHELYKNIQSIEDVRIFMEHHVYPVWDFMSLLKSLQHKLTGVTLPWMPTADPLSRRLMNQIVVVEESDIDENGNATSHFELYLRAMKTCKANTSVIEGMMEGIRRGQPFSAVLSTAPLPPTVYQFLKNTWDLVDKAPLHEVAAVFALAREGLIPDMLMSMVATLKSQFSEELRPFYYYLERHIEEDENHAEMAYHMLSTLCKDDTNKWDDAEQAVNEALRARLTLWDGALAKIKESR
jgi:hypothetical protein